MPYTMIAPFLLILLCLIANPLKLNASEPTAFRTDANADEKLPWYALVAGEFPPEDSGHYFSGELIKVDHLQRSFMLRVDRTNKQNRSHFDLPVAATMLPFGSISYHGAPADLADIPVGTHLHGLFYLKDANDQTPPLEIFHNRRSYEVDFNRCFRIEDDFSYRARQGQLWRIDEVNLTDAKLTVTMLQAEEAVGQPQTFDLQASTRVWQGDRVVTAESLAPGQLVQFNITWATLYGPGRLVEIWLDEASRQLATAHQLTKHHVHMRQRGLPGWIDAVDNHNRVVTITLFDGADPTLLEEIVPSDQAGIAVAAESLLMHDPVNDRKRGPILDIKQVPIQPGSSGIQIRVQPDLLLEGFRPKHIVRIYPSAWPVVSLPKEQELFGR